MVTVQEAEKIIQSQKKEFGTEYISFERALGRVLAEDIKTDRDLPPYNRVTMDGIAISYDAFTKGIRSFHIITTQAAGDDAKNILGQEECIEIMTGAVLPSSTDLVIRYEDLEIKNGTANVLTESVTKGQNIHFKGNDKKQNEIVAVSGQFITPVIINMAAAVGKINLLVKKVPRIVIISSGDELIDVHETPLPHQVRSSNNYAIKSVLQEYAINADFLHIPDNMEIIQKNMQYCLEHYDVLIVSGGVSMGKFDYIHQALEELSVKKLFHKVLQRPGKPFWFGIHSNGVLVFAFPGNPVSTFMCLHRYFLTWLETSLGVGKKSELVAILGEPFTFTPSLQYFLQVKINVNSNGHLIATPSEGNGSGDFSNLLYTDAFMELPLERNNFHKGEVYKIWPYNKSRW